MTVTLPRGIADLSGRAKFSLVGEDRVRFLNGQVSNDVRKASAGRAIHACVLTPKGKMCGDIFVWAAADTLRCDADAALRESLAARLERYIIADDAVLKDVTDKFKILHTIGIDLTVIEKAGLAGFPSVTVNRFGFDGTDFWLEPGAFAKAWTDLRSTALVLDANSLETLRIAAGIPRWGYELSEETIPNEAGLDHTSVDYEKGCYVGQEIISRLKSIGHVNKTLCGFTTDAPVLIRGARLFTTENPDKETGWVTSAAFDPARQKTVALGYLKRGVSASEFLARDLETSQEWTLQRASFPILL